jgi:hypothetical protein
MKQLVTMRAALTDPQLLGGILAGDSFDAWRVFLIAAMGEQLTSSNERKIFRRLTGGRRTEPGVRVDEFWAIVGRRGGKSRAASVLATYLGGLVDHSDACAVGEVPVILCLAQNQRTAAVELEYIAGAFAASPMLAPLVTNRTADVLELSTGVRIEVRAASARGLRGITCAAVIADEAAFWNTDDESVNADSEILTAVRPTLATTTGPLVVISSPYAPRGEVWQAYRDHYGKRGDKRILVVQGASRDFNPSLPESVVRRALQRDAASARAEYLGEFRNDIESFISRPLVDACIVRGRVELPPVAGTTYYGFVDPASGVSASGAGDSMCLGIAHLDAQTGRAVLDLVREVKPPFAPNDVVALFAEALKLYGISRVHSDRYSLGWTAERFEAHGIRLEYSPRSKSEIFLELLPLLSGRAVELLDNPRLVSQLLTLDRRVAHGGKESVDGGAHKDDLINSAAGALVLTQAQAQRRYLWGSIPRGPLKVAELFDRFARRVVADPNAKRPDGTSYSTPLADRRSAVEQLRDAPTQTAIGKEILGQMFREGRRSHLDQ